MVSINRGQMSTLLAQNIFKQHPEIFLTDMNNNNTHVLSQGETPAVICSNTDVPSENNFSECYMMSN